MNQQPRSQNSRLGRALRRVAKMGAALGSAALLTVGAALPAQAATYDVTSGHADVVSINSSNVVGSIFDDLSPSWRPYDDGHSYRLIFDRSTTPQITCSNGVFTVPNNFAIEPNSPFTGFSNSSSSAYDLRMTRASGPGHAAFSTSSGVVLNTAPAPLTWALASGSHIHGAWTFNSGTTSCASGQLYTFSLNFWVRKSGDVVGANSRAFTFIVKS